MFIAKTFSKIKTVLAYVLFTYTVVQATAGWIFMIKETITAIKEARARRKK
jgi:hypothetical protein